jgi:hypothetical protein
MRENRIRLQVESLEDRFAPSCAGLSWAQFACSEPQVAGLDSSGAATTLPPPEWGQISAAFGHDAACPH